MFRLFNKKSEGEKVILKITGMHCTGCAMNIDGALEDELDGVNSASTSYARSETNVVYDPVKTNIEEIKKVIKKAGYESEVTE